MVRRVQEVRCKRSRATTRELKCAWPARSKKETAGGQRVSRVNTRSLGRAAGEAGGQAWLGARPERSTEDSAAHWAAPPPAPPPGAQSAG